MLGAAMKEPRLVVEKSCMNRQSFIPCHRLVIGSIALGLSLLALPAIAQQAGDSAGAMHVGASVQVSKDLADAPHGETEMGADPQDANRLVACSMIFPNESPSAEVATYVSLDGGSS